MSGLLCIDDARQSLAMLGKEDWLCQSLFPKKRKYQARK